MKPSIARMRQLERERQTLNVEALRLLGNFAFKPFGTVVYSARLSRADSAALEDQARALRLSPGLLLKRIAREWLDGQRPHKGAGETPSRSFSSASQ